MVLRTKSSEVCVLCLLESAEYVEKLVTSVSPLINPFYSTRNSSGRLSPPFTKLTEE